MIATLFLTAPVRPPDEALGLLGIILLVGFVVLQLFRKRPETQIPGFQAPKVEDGAFMPIISGVGEIGPNIRWFGDLEARKRGDYIAYRGRMIYMLAMGPVDQLLDILFDDQAISQAPGTKQFGPALNVALPYARPADGSHLELFVQSDNLYGGKKQGGGPVGLMHLHWGTSNDVVCELSRDAFGDTRASAWPRWCYGTFGWIADPPGDDLFNAADWTETADYGGDFTYGGTTMVMNGLWTVGIGGGNGVLYTEQQFTGLDPASYYTFSLRVYKSNGGTGGLDFWSISFPDGLGGSPSTDYYNFATGGIQTLLIKAKPTAGGVLTLRIGASGIEYGDSRYEMTMFDAHWSGTPGAPQESYGGPYRTIDPFQGLKQPIPSDGKFEFCMNTPVPPGVRFLLQRLPIAVTGAGVGLDANPADMLWEKRTDPLIGMGGSTGRLELSSYEAFGTVCQNEGLGLSETLETPTAVKDQIDAVLAHSNAVEYVDPATGKLNVMAIRADYDPGTIPVISRAGGASKIKVQRPDPADLISEVQVRYRRFEAGWPKTVTGEVLTPALVPGEQYEVPATSVVIVAVRQGATTLALETDYQVRDGVLSFPSTGGAVIGLPVEVDYQITPRGDGVVGFTDSTQRAQNLAVFQALGRNVVKIVDRPLITKDSLAQREASRLCRVLSQPLASVSWEQNRTGWPLHEGSVVKVASPEDGADDLIVRITKVTRGTALDRKMKFEGVEDEFANDVAIYIPVSDGAGGDFTGGQLQAPKPAGLVALDPSAITLALYSADPSFDFELQIADDEAGTGAVIVPLDGSTTTYTDAQTVGTTKSYWLRHVADGYLPSDWIGPVTYTAASGATPSPSVVLPTITIAQSDDGTTGTATITVTDPQHRLISLEAATKPGNTAEGDLLDVDGPPYSVGVALVAGEESTIRVVATYYDANGDEATFERTVSWNAATAASGLSYTTAADESASLPGSRQWADGTGSTVDLSEAGKIKINVTGGGGGGGSVDIIGTATFELKTVGESVELPVDDGWTITEAEILAVDASGTPVSGSAVVDILRATDAGYPTFASIAAAAKPTLASQDRVVDTTLTGWTTGLTDGDTVRATLESSDVDKVIVALKLTKSATVNVSVPRIITVSRTLTIAGEIVEIPIDADATILEAEIQADAPGNASVEASRATDAGYPTFARIDGGTATALVSQQRVKDATLAGWTPNLSAGDTARFRLATMGPGLTRVTFALKLQIGSGTGIGGFTGSPTVGSIPKIIGAQTLGDSSLDDSGSRLASAKGIDTPAREVTADDDAVVGDHIIVCRGTLTLTLCAVSAMPYGELVIINDSAGALTVAAAGTDLIAVTSSETATIALAQGDVLVLRALERSPTPNVWRAT